MNRAARNRAMTLVAQLIDVAYIQQTRVLRPVRRVAAHAAFALHRRMLEHKRSARFGVALRADRILVSRRLEVVGPKCPMRVMAIAALHQAFIHLVMEGHVECRLHVGMALEAKLRLRRLQELRLGVAGMHTVAAGAAYAGFGVGRALEVRMRPRMAAQARLTHLRRCHLGELLDLGRIATTLDVSLPWTVAALAGRSRTVRQLNLGMWVVGELLRHLGVAGLAGFRTNIVGGIRSGGLLHRGCLLASTRSIPWPRKHG